MENNVRYHAFYCEENVWHLLQHASMKDVGAYAVFITAEANTVPLWSQRAGVEAQPVFWDYHVLVVGQTAGWQVWDLDHVPGAPSAVEVYLDVTFPNVAQWPLEHQPRFRVVDKETFVQTFASDRSHMRGADGAFLEPPPPWPCIGAGRPNTLLSFLDGSPGGPGAMLDVVSFRERFSTLVGA